MDGAQQDLVELASNLPLYEQQQREVGQLLLDDPDNEELQAIFENLTEVRSGAGLLSNKVCTWLAPPQPQSLASVPRPAGDTAS